LFCRDQDFANYLSIRNHRKAIELALAMGQPRRLLKLFDDIRSHAEPSSITGDSAVDEVLRTLSGPDLARILRYVRDWNASAKTSEVAQSVLYAIFKLRKVDDVIGAFGHDSALAINPASHTHENLPGNGDGGSTSLRDVIDALIPYTERHLGRMERLVQDSYVVDYVLGEMDDGMFDGVEISDEGAMDVDMGATAVR
jgi:U3 small nucleolar RNA-associated protein 13